LHSGKQRTLGYVDIEGRKLLLAIALHLNEEAIKSGFGGIEAKVQVRPAAIFRHKRPRDLGMDVQSGRAVFAKTDNMSEGTHDWLELGKAAAVLRRDMDNSFGWLSGFERAIKREGILQAAGGGR
jgi:hypothetical protein